VFLGSTLNQIVLTANHDTFPVTVNEIKAKHRVGDGQVLSNGTVMLDETHCIASDKTHLNILGDILDKGDGIESIGDVLIDFGGWAWHYCVAIWGFIVTLKLATRDRK
jgi:hypothetical protein